MSTIKKLPSSERPRERLLKWGAERLSLQELIAIILVTGTRFKSVSVLSEELLSHFKGFEGLLSASVNDFTQIKGIGLTKAIKLKAAFEMVRRGFFIQEKENSHIVDAKTAYLSVRDLLMNQKKEMIAVILKDVRERLINVEIVGVGTLSQVLVHPREIFHPVVKAHAHSFILVHNHPSGDCSPSKADVELTLALIKASQVMGVKLEDHLIVSNKGYFSLKDEKLVSF
ncbi:MAG: RadC family protein [Rhabdochlamydiaceae bacterium]